MFTRYILVFQQSHKHDSKINACLVAYRSRIIIVKSLSAAAALFIYVAKIIMLSTTKIGLLMQHDPSQGVRECLLVGRCACALSQSHSTMLTSYDCNTAIVVKWTWQCSVSSQRITQHHIQVLYVWILCIKCVNELYMGKAIKLTNTYYEVYKVVMCSNSSYLTCYVMLCVNELACPWFIGCSSHRQQRSFSS